MTDESAVDCRVARERAARKEAERLLEEKSRELFLINQELEASHEAVQAAKDYIDRVITSMLNALLVTDPELRIQSVNRAAVSLLDHEEAALIGNSLYDFFDEADDVNRADIGELLADRVARSGETTCVSRWGERIPVQYSLSVLEAHDGEAQGLVCVLQDVSDQKLLERRLGEARKLEAIGQLAAGIAHEINTPIQYIGDNTRFVSEAVGALASLVSDCRGLLEAAKQGAPLEDQMTRVETTTRTIDLDFLLEELPSALSQSMEGVEQVAELVRAMKQFSHPGTREKTLTDINDTIRSTATVARNEWKYVADVDLQLADDLPLVPCLPAAINQVVLNMIVNAAHAIEAAAENGTKGTITISTALAGDEVEIRIADDGPGMPESVRSRVFDPFFTTKEIGKGTGQGLAISHDVVVHKHGGTLDVESTEGVGTTFLIRLPLSGESGETASHDNVAA